MSSDLSFEDDVYRSYVSLPPTNDDNRFEETIYRGLAPPLESHSASSFWSPFEASDQLAPLSNKPSLHKNEAGALARLEPIGEPLACQDAIEEEWDSEDTIEGPFSSALLLEHAGWVEPLTSFGCGARPPHTVLNRVCAHLTAAHVPFSVDASQASVEGRFEAGAGCCGFVLRAFRGDRGDGVFELQRRHGCVLLFSDLYRRMLTWLGSAVKQQLTLPWELPASTLPPLSDLGEIPPPLMLGDLPPPLSLTQEDTSALLTMLDDKQQDVQLEGLRILATAAKENTQSATVVCDLLAPRAKEWELNLPQDDLHKGYELNYELTRWKKVVIATVQEQDLNPGANN